MSLQLILKTDIWWEEFLKLKPRHRAGDSIVWRDATEKGLITGEIYGCVPVSFSPNGRLHMVFPKSLELKVRNALISITFRPGRVEDLLIFIDAVVDCVRVAKRFLCRIGGGTHKLERIVVGDSLLAAVSTASIEPVMLLGVLINELKYELDLSLLTYAENVLKAPYFNIKLEMGKELKVVYPLVMMVCLDVPNSNEGPIVLLPGSHIVELSYRIGAGYTVVPSIGSGGFNVGPGHYILICDELKLRSWRDMEIKGHHSPISSTSQKLG